MRSISRTALGAATAVAPSVVALADTDPAAGTRPITGSAKAGDGPAKAVVVTLVTGDKLQVWQGSSGPDAATARPGPNGTLPVLQTRTSGRDKDLYVFPESESESESASASGVLAAGRVDRELFNVSGLIRQGYDDAHAKSLPLVAVHDNSVNVARGLPPTARAATRGPVLAPVGGIALKSDKAKAAEFWADITDTRSKASSDLGEL